MKKQSEVKKDSFGEFIRDRRKHLKMSSEEVALKAHISTSYVNHIEKNRKLPSIHVVDDLAKALNLNKNELRKLAGYAPETEDDFFDFLDEKANEEGEKKPNFREQIAEISEILPENLSYIFESLNKINEDINTIFHRINYFEREYRKTIVDDTIYSSIYSNIREFQSYIDTMLTEIAAESDMPFSPTPFKDQVISLLKSLEFSLDINNKETQKKLDALLKKTALNHTINHINNNIIPFPGVKRKRKINYIEQAVGAGKTFADCKVIGTFSMELPFDADYAFLVSGMSMAPDIIDGDLIFVKATKQWKERDIVIAYLKDTDEWTVKQIYYGRKGYEVTLRGTWKAEYYKERDIVIQGIFKYSIRDKEIQQEIFEKMNEVNIHE